MPLQGLRMNKVPEFPRAHDFSIGFMIPIESAAVTRATIVPLITSDEGLGAMSAFKTNPVNASFVEVNTDHCYPTSRIDRIFSQLIVNMNKIMLETDKVHVTRFAVATIHTSFMDGQLAEDEVSGLDLNEIIELQNESTDRQTFPLFTNVKLKDFKTNAQKDMPAETPGLTTDLEIEAVAFSQNAYYDCLHYMTNGNKLPTIMTSLRWYTLTRTNPAKTLYFNQQSNTKYMNPYTFLGAFIYYPENGSSDQYGKASDTTVETSGLEFALRTRYNEHNHEFNHAML